jgi:lipoate-protein ligase A
MPGKANMALDESMLDRIPDGVAAMVRVYRWSEPTLSLGHFQTMPQDTTATWGGLPQVTRKTGGGAIVHHHEMTYCLAVASTSAAGKKGHSEKLYRAVHNSLVDALRDLGWNAQLSEACTCNRNSAGGSSPFLCFDRRSPVDVVIDGNKIAGSAQRRTIRGLIQHGSVLLRSSDYAPHLPGILELSRTVSCENPSNVLRKGAEADAESEPMESPKPVDLDTRLNEGWLVEILTNGLLQALS